MLTLNEFESEVVLCRSYTFLERYASSLIRSIPVFDPLGGLAKVVSAMHGLPQVVQIAIVILLGFTVLCMTVIAIIRYVK